MTTAVVKRSITTRELVARIRVLHGKRTLSVREWEVWLADLAAKGILERDGDEWSLTPLGCSMLKPLISWRDE